MSDIYEIKGVRITPQGGGFYLLTHPSLPEPVRERGKENADTRAEQIADALALDDGSSMHRQDATLEGVTSPLHGGETTSGQVIQGAASIGQGTDDLVATQDENARLKAVLETTQAALEKAENGRQEALRAAHELETKTVRTDGGAVPEVDQGTKVPAAVPRAFSGVLDDKEKARLKKLGVETTRIILEDNESIPPTGLFLGHNGRGYSIVPGEEVDVPNFLLGVLDDAVMSAPTVDSKTQKVLGYRNRMKYPYRRV